MVMLKIISLYIYKDFDLRLRILGLMSHVTIITRMATYTTIDKNNEKNDKFYRKVAFLMYTEMVNFRPQS